MNPEHLAILQSGVENWNQWREENPGITSDLSGANLREAFLQGVNLYEANLRGANLEKADLWRVNLWRADLQGSDLQEADLQRSYLQEADFQEADLQGADLERADLYRANLQEANLQRAKLQGANLQGAKFKNTTYGKGVPISKEPIQIIGLRWLVLIFDEHMKIGCELHSFKEWKKFTDEEIDKMHKKALAFWNKNKKHLLNICKNR